MCLLLWRLCRSGRSKTRLPFLWLLELSSSFPTRALPTLGSATVWIARQHFLVIIRTTRGLVLCHQL